jgi:hypothetical protein
VASIEGSRPTGLSPGHHISFPAYPLGANKVRSGGCLASTLCCTSSLPCLGAVLKFHCSGGWALPLTLSVLVTSYVWHAGVSVPTLNGLSIPALNGRRVLRNHTLRRIVRHALSSRSAFPRTAGSSSVLTCTSCTPLTRAAGVSRRGQSQALWRLASTRERGGVPIGLEQGVASSSGATRFLPPLLPSWLGWTCAANRLSCPLHMQAPTNGRAGGHDAPGAAPYASPAGCASGDRGTPACRAG